MVSSEKITVLQDFSLGLNTTTAPNRLDNRFSPTHTNVWNDDGAIAKKLGQSRVNSTQQVWGNNWYGQSMHRGYYSLAEQVIVLSDIGQSRNVLLYLTAANLNTLRMNTGGTGTAATTSGSTTVTGTGTNWLTTARAGSLISIGNDIRQINSVNSNTDITLTATFPTTNSTTAYIITHSFPPTRRVAYSDMNSKTWICARAAIAATWDGYTQGYADNFPQADFSITNKNYMFSAATTANQSRVSWSAIKDPTTWPASNFVDVNPNDGYAIVGLEYDGQSIIIFKTNGAYKLTGDVFDPTNPTYTLTKIFTPYDFALRGSKTFQLFGKYGYIILGTKGFYSYDGNAFAKILDYDRIRGEFANMGSFDLSDIPVVSAEPSAIVVDGNYWLQVPNRVSTISTSHKEFTYVLDKSGAVWKWTALAGGIISDFAYMAGTLYGVNSYSSGTAGALMQLNTGNTNGLTDAINGSLTTKISEFAKQQRFGQCFVYFKKQSAGNLTFEYSVDEGSFSSTTIDMTAGTGTRVKSQAIIIGTTGRSIQFRLSNNTVAQTMEIYAVEFHHQELRR